MLNLSKKNILAVVPARGGSKGIPQKNLKKIGNNSLIGIAGLLLQSIPWITKSIISSDDDEMISEACKNGLEAPFKRPIYLSNDHTNSLDMWKHALIESENFYNISFDYTILIEPTSPMRCMNDIELTINKLLYENYQSAATVSLTPAHFTPHKTLIINYKNTIDFYLQNGKDFTIRQNIPNYYHRNGICYACTRNYLLNTTSIITDNTAAVIISREVVNIDTIEDLDYANYLFTKIKKVV
jgi:CMP-N,N'-diacetyllegionaminic acid synthase